MISSCFRLVKPRARSRSTRPGLDGGERLVVEHDITIEDVEYVRHGDRPLVARLYRPHGRGPFPAMVYLHSGAWCSNDRTTDDALCRALALSGVVVASLDFTMPPRAPYPASLLDINYGIRWVKANADDLATRPDTVGVMGASSGGHQAILTAMRPHDARYAALPSPRDRPGAFDATVCCAVLLWPVIDPLGRYRYAQQLKAGHDAPAVAELVLHAHVQYWGTEDAMAEGSPVLALERGESSALPPVLYIQGTEDVVHPRDHLERFVTLYRAAGGLLRLELADGARQGFIRLDPEAPESARAREQTVEFIHEHVR